MTKIPRDIRKKLNSKHANIDTKFKANLKNNIFQEEIMSIKANSKKSNNTTSFLKKYNLGPVLAVMFMIVFVGSASAAVTTSRVNQTREQEMGLPTDLAAVLSIDDIRAIAVAEVPSQTVTGIELEQEDGVLVYKVKFSDGSYRLYDANTGIALNKDSLEVDESVPAGFVAGISLQEARSIAQNERIGKTITKIELEVENGVVVYSVRFSDGGRVIVNATNGSIIVKNSDDDSSTSSNSSADDSQSDDNDSEDEKDEIEDENEVESEDSSDNDSDGSSSNSGSESND